MLRLWLGLRLEIELRLWHMLRLSLGPSLAYHRLTIISA